MTAKCCMGGNVFGPEHQCVNDALPFNYERNEGLWCAACQANIRGDGPPCDCPGCSLPPPGGASE